MAEKEKIYTLDDFLRGIAPEPPVVIRITLNDDDFEPGAAREVRKLTKGAVTDSRARVVYRKRCPGSYDPPKQPPTEESEENQVVDTESDSVANIRDTYRYHKGLDKVAEIHPRPWTGQYDLSASFSRLIERRTHGNTGGTDRLPC